MYFEIVPNTRTILHEHNNFTFDDVFGLHAHKPIHFGASQYPRKQYSLCFQIKITFSEISLKVRQTNWNVAKNNVNVVVDGLPSQITIYTCLSIDIWSQRRRRTSTQFYALWWPHSILQSHNLANTCRKKTLMCRFIFLNNSLRDVCWSSCSWFFDDQKSPDLGPGIRGTH